MSNAQKQEAKRRRKIVDNVKALTKTITKKTRSKA